MAAGFNPTGPLSTSAGFNQPTTVANQPTNLNFIGALELANALGALKPDVGEQLVPRYGYQSLIGIMKEQFGAGVRLGASSIVRHFEEDFIHSRISLDSTSAGSAGAAVTVNFNTNDVLSVGQESPYIGSATTDVAVPFPYAIIQFENGVEAIVTEVDVSAETFVAYPVDASDNIPAIQNGDYCIIKGTAVQEGSSPIQERNSRIIYYENYMMRHRNDMTVTGTAGGEILWFKIPRRDGAPGLEDVWTSKAIGDTYLRHMNEMEMLLLDGKSITNTNIPGVSNFETVQKTEGLIETIESAGNVSTYTADAMSLADLRDLTDSFLRFKAPKSHIVPCGYDFHADFNTLFREGDGVDLFASGPGRVNFANFDGTNQTINLDIQGAQFQGFKFALMPMDLFADVQLLGSVDKYPGLGTFIPVGNTVRYLDENPESAETVPTIEIVAKRGFNGDSREVKEWIYGGLGNGSDGDDKLKYAVLSEFALEVNAVNRFGIMKTDASS